MSGELTPEEMVTDAVANTELAGGRIDPDWRAVLLRIATGELDIDDAIRMALARVASHRSDPPH
jgi:antitoxin component of RelBE/YafQ-DinJ toxin-antitoxin module